MTRLTKEMKKYITEYSVLSSRECAEELSKKFTTMVSHTTVANFRKKRPVKIETLQKVTTPKRTPTPGKIKYPLSIDEFNKLLQANKDHIDYQYLNRMLIKPGKLSSDFRKLLGFIRDRV